jgi:hypothetical protein
VRNESSDSARFGLRPALVSTPASQAFSFLAAPA